jgi:hypothetical protein
MAFSESMGDILASQPIEVGGDISRNDLMNRNIRLVLDPLLQMALVGINGAIRQSLSAFEAGKAGNGLAKNERAR